MSFSAKKNTKNAPRRIKTRPRAFIYRRTRVFCLPRAGAGAYIARIWQPAPQNPPRNPPQRTRRARSLRRNRANAARLWRGLATATRSATAAISTRADARADGRRMRTRSNLISLFRPRNGRSSKMPPKRQALSILIFCEI